MGGCSWICHTYALLVDTDLLQVLTCFRLVSIHQDRGLRLCQWRSILQWHLSSWRISTVANLLSINQLDTACLRFRMAIRGYHAGGDPNVVDKEDQQNCSSMLRQIVADSSCHRVCRNIYEDKWTRDRMSFSAVLDLKRAMIWVISSQRTYKSFNCSFRMIFFSIVLLVSSLSIPYWTRHLIRSSTCWTIPKVSSKNRSIVWRRTILSCPTSACGKATKLRMVKLHWNSTDHRPRTHR